ncbi:unknown [Crocosphaera subtropica ATCC 51142]|uniref:Ureidoglycolate hydrolase n=1 Tax=Crocosphaera subtropica (strain ATCC 51142 / BH68) TaxID=43989 RepID=B1WZV1_CROS5|nr:ureidoglycolate lyase [Crocosphaera subtropica]ACB52850.1 unknown [Crocosphaera subtropica ATCC 51142]
MTQVTTVQSLKIIHITTENFKAYGQLITPSEDGKVYDETDAQLHLDNGTPRFYIMRLQERGRQFHRITRHQQCTQCLGSLEGKEWFIAVAPPSDENYPNIEQLQAFKIPGNCFIKLEVGTWHAGPYFDHDYVDFYNLELSDTNVVDHFTYNFLKQDNLTFKMVS